MQVVALILAAGASTRFGSPKQLVLIGGRTMLEMVAATAHAAGLRPVLAVVPPGLAVPDDIVPIVNDRPDAGISRSIRLGLAAVPIETEAAVILLGDEPLMTKDAVEAVLSAARAGADAVATNTGDRLGPPVLLRRELFHVATAAASGDQGLGPMLRDFPGLTLVDATEAPVDVDTPDDLARVLGRLP